MLNPDEMVAALVRDTSMTQDEVIEEMIRGAVVHFDLRTGKARFQTHDEMSPDVRECIRINRAIGKLPTDAGRILKTPEADAAFAALADHKRACADCIASDLDEDAADCREDGDEERAQMLEAKAARVRLKNTAQLRDAKEANPNPDLCILVADVRCEADAQDMKNRITPLAVAAEPGATRALSAFMFRDSDGRPLTVMIAPCTPRAAQWLNDNPRKGITLDQHISCARAAGLVVETWDSK